MCPVLQMLRLLLSVGVQFQDTPEPIPGVEAESDFPFTSIVLLSVAGVA